MTPEERRKALELEFDRLKARQDYLDRALTGDPDIWLGIIERMPPTVAEVTVDKAVAEARQGALAMATIVKTLDGATAGGNAVPTSGQDPADEIRERREEKQKKAAREAAAQS